MNETYTEIVFLYFGNYKSKKSNYKDIKINRNKSYKIYICNFVTLSKLWLMEHTQETKANK